LSFFDRADTIIEESALDGRSFDVKAFPSLLLAIALAATPALAQDILTADKFFKDVSSRYSELKDYEAAVSVIAGKQTMAGTVIYKAPSLMRMDFSQPESQVIVYDGQNLVVYVPEFRAVLTQQTGSTTSAAAATGEGLRMLGRNYSVAYETGPTPTPLPEAESESVIRLVLSRLTVAEGFRTITLSINPTTLLIRRMEGVTLAGDLISYDFTKIKLDQGIPATKFIYDSPASANMYNNFLFSSEN
jgi:outer membrane lipoprotein-sorting protein